MTERLKLIVLDDDPTGSQTVHSCPLLLRWDAETLRRGLAHPSPLLFVLANTRALDGAVARQRVREICCALKPLLAEAIGAGWFESWMLVCRGDSTLRSHFPLEAEVVAEELGPFDSTLLVPAFIDGGRTTVQGMHLLHDEPVHRSAFARDGFLGYSTSYLPDWVEEKSAGRIASDQVEIVTVLELNQASESQAAFDSLCRRFHSFHRNVIVVLDAQTDEHINLLGSIVRSVHRSGHRMMVQSAASFLSGLADLPAQPLLAHALPSLRRWTDCGHPMPGLVVVGSHVPLADMQLSHLLADPFAEGVEIPVDDILTILDGTASDKHLVSLVNHLTVQVQIILEQKLTPVLFTSRGERSSMSSQLRRRLGDALAGSMATVVHKLSQKLGYVISKGGITTNSILADGLNMRVVELQGQLMPGLSLVMAGTLPVVTFPGNLGDRSTLYDCWRLMEAKTNAE